MIARPNRPADNARVTDHGSPYAEMTTAFTSSRLPVPPVPEPLRPQLRTVRDWCWSTRDIDAFAMYMFDRDFLSAVLSGSVPDYVAVSHAGHGVNSYAVNYHLVCGPLAVIMQVGWGGIYTDNAAASQRLGEYWRRCMALHARGADASGGRILCVFSHLRGISACGPLPQPSDGDVDAFLTTHRTAGDAAFDEAERLLAHR
ncbi:hypothetical protein GCM10018962_52200 [Dactylosporangium matsuzakiense]|uniref:Uncharacterized protein n=1 Tax=Dactylosporangium matsuzakiense TaxID=53360 RepID=A0A9W6KTP8_9ACTN|nr:hypothetical protein GCM10017581_087560 [Dactylosporangium matsuzakiense]